jgi:hypothetical protein
VCPTYSWALQAVNSHEPVLEAAAGKCGELKWVMWSSGFAGETTYFDAKDALVCVEGWADYYGACSGKSPTIVYGSRPDCVQETTVTLKARDGVEPR